MLEILKMGIICLIILLAGGSIARQGIVRGRVSAKVGALDIRLMGRRVVADFVNFRDGLVFYRLAILPVS